LRLLLSTLGARRGKPETTEIRLWPKIEACDKLAKHLGMYVERIALTEPTGNQSAQIRFIEVADVDDDETLTPPG